MPNNATPEEFAAAEKYNKGVQEYFAKYGVKVPIRGVKTTAQNKRGSCQIIHLEPAFGADKEAMEVMKNYPEEYAQVVSNAFSGLPVTVIAPHTNRMTLVRLLMDSAKEDSQQMCLSLLLVD